MDNTVKAVTNEEMLKAIAALGGEDGKGPETQNAVTNALVHACFLLPVFNPFEGKHDVKDEESLPPCILNNSNDRQQWLPLFTDWSELTRTSQTAFTKHVIKADISDAYSYLVSNDKLAGIVVNPFGKSLPLNRKVVENVAKFWSIVKTAELNGETPPAPGTPQQMQISVPQAYPEDIGRKLVEGLAKIDDVKQAWLCTASRAGSDGSAFSWLVIVNSVGGIKGREQLFGGLARELIPFSEGHKVGFTAAAPQYSNILQNTAPIYSANEG